LTEAIENVDTFAGFARSHIVIQTKNTDSIRRKEQNVKKTTEIR
jgi:hypothetical protein